MGFYHLQDIDMKIRQTQERYAKTIEDEKEKRKVYFQKISRIPEVKKEIDEKKDYEHLKFVIDSD